jgi:hypothetical protein
MLAVESDEILIEMRYWSRENVPGGKSAVSGLMETSTWLSLGSSLQDELTVPFLEEIHFKHVVMNE